MRWDRLFDDLEAQWEAESRRDLDQEVADRTRRERASVGLYERLARSVGEPLSLRLVTGGGATGSVLEVGQDWLLLEEAAGLREAPSRPLLLPFSALVAVSGVGARAGGSPMGRRFAFGYALRGLSRDRAAVVLTDVSGATASGTIDAVGADCFDLSEHPADEVRRPENVTGRRVVPFSAVACLRPA